MEACVYCAVEPLPEQLYETKLFRVLVARQSFTNGHVIIVRKMHDPHLYSFTSDDIDEFGYLLKKVSFWVMRLTNASGFTTVMHDGTPEVNAKPHLEAHVIPRHMQAHQFGEMIKEWEQKTTVLMDDAILQTLKELKDLMQLPQPPM